MEQCLRVYTRRHCSTGRGCTCRTKCVCGQIYENKKSINDATVSRFRKKTPLTLYKPDDTLNIQGLLGGVWVHGWRFSVKPLYGDAIGRTRDWCHGPSFPRVSRYRSCVCSLQKLLSLMIFASDTRHPKISDCV